MKNSDIPISTIVFFFSIFLFWFNEEVFFVLAFACLLILFCFLSW